MNSEWFQIVRHPEQSEGSLLCGRTHESPSPPALSHRREREPVEEYATNQWRTLEAATHKPGALGSLVHKRVYTHTNGDAIPDAWADYTYGYDAVGNVYCVWDDDGNEIFSFAQDAFGNELPVDLYGQDSWSTARSFGINEHQTGKWIDPFTGLYYFHARWYDSGVGRFVGRDPVTQVGGSIYGLSTGNPFSSPDPTGMCPNCVARPQSTIGIFPLPPPPPPETPCQATPPYWWKPNCSEACDDTKRNYEKRFPEWWCECYDVNAWPFLPPDSFGTHRMLLCCKKSNPQECCVKNPSIGTHPINILPW